MIIAIMAIIIAINNGHNGKVIMAIMAMPRAILMARMAMIEGHSGNDNGHYCHNHGNK